MTERLFLAEKILKRHQFLESHPDQKALCMVGFDGFTDEIISVVDKRYQASSFDPMHTIQQFGERILSAAGKSCNIELVVREKRLGGNAPLMARGLVEGAHRLVFVGAIGANDLVEPLFQPLADRCEQVITLCSSGHSDALEFNDGKVFLGKLASLLEVNRETLLKHLALKDWISLLDRTSLLACANWTMLPMMTDIWKWMKQDIVPHLNQKSRWLFVDLADPAKRTDRDLKEALEALKNLNGAYSVILGLNQAESERVARVLGIQIEGDEPEKVKGLAQKIRAEVSYQQVVIHHKTFAVTASNDGAWAVKGPYVQKPLLSTGGGDNFNAGYCTGLLYGCTPEEALLVGVSTSGYYVQFAQTPTMEQLTRFIYS